jgi:hypothetical protein
MPTNVDGERAERSARFPQCKAANLVACSFEPRKKDLMISKIISRAACLRELASNPKSFSNCPDLHGGVPDLPGVNRPKGKACITRLGFGRIRPRQQSDSESFGEPNFAL